MSSIITVPNLLKYYSNNIFLISINAAVELVKQNDMTNIS